jgi:hypothetical protein
MRYMNKRLVSTFSLALVISAPLPVLAADAGGPVYTLPKRGAPGGRVGGGVRGGTQRDMFLLSVLAPDHSGLTTSEQPSLYWYISTETALPVEVTIMDPQGVEPILETRLPAPVNAGVHRFRLADHNVRLAPGKAYRWFVAVVPDTDRRSKDILAGGAIERVEAPSELQSKLTDAGKDRAYFVYAEAGLWYDALKAISDQIDAAPENQELRKQRAALLSQVGVPAIAE